MVYLLTDVSADLFLNIDIDLVCLCLLDVASIRPAEKELHKKTDRALRSALPPEWLLYAERPNSLGPLRDQVRAVHNATWSQANRRAQVNVDISVDD